MLTVRVSILFIIIFNLLIMAGGYVDLYSVEPSSEKLTLNRINAEELSSNLVFVGMQDRIDSDPSLIKKINGVFVYNITKNGKPVATWSKLTS